MNCINVEKSSINSFILHHSGLSKTLWRAKGYGGHGWPSLSFRNRESLLFFLLVKPNCHLYDICVFREVFLTWILDFQQRSLCLQESRCFFVKTAHFKGIAAGTQNQELPLMAEISHSNCNKGTIQGRVKKVKDNKEAACFVYSMIISPSLQLYAKDNWGRSCHRQGPAKIRIS